MPQAIGEIVRLSAKADVALGSSGRIAHRNRATDYVLIEDLCLMQYRIERPLCRFGRFTRDCSLPCVPLRQESESAAHFIQHSEP